MNLLNASQNAILTILLPNANKNKIANLLTQKLVQIFSLVVFVNMYELTTKTSNCIYYKLQ